MKKTLKLTAAALALVMALSGCSIKSNDSTVNANVDAKSITDIYVNAGDTQDVDTSEAFNVYMDACEKMENTSSITIVSDMYVGTGEGDNESKSSSLVTIKRQMVDDSFDVSLNMTNTYNDEDQPSITGYYTGGYLYFSSEDDKVKEEMGYEDLMGIIGNYVFSFDEEVISQASCLADGDDIKYFFNMDNEKMAQMLENNFVSSGYTFEEGDYIETEYAGIEAVINSDGIITGFKLGMKAIIHDSMGDTPVIYNIDSEFMDIDNTEVDAIDNMDEYMTTEEYMAQLEEESAAESETEAAETAAEETTAAE